MTFNLGGYMRENYGDAVVVLQSEAAQRDYEVAVTKLRSGRSNGTAFLTALVLLGVPAGQIRRVMAGENLATVWAG